jgi:DNA-binding NarL/FixJ family response regulator
MHDKLLFDLPNRTKEGFLETARDVKQAKIDQRRASVLALLSEGLSPADIAGELNVTVRTIKRDITALNGQVQVTL